MTILNNPVLSDLIIQERDILTRIAEGGPLDQVLRDLVLLVERPSNGEMLASVLFVSPDGRRLLQGAAPSLPTEYNEAIHGIAIGDNVGSCGTAAHFGRPVIVRDIATDPLWKDFRGLALKHDLHACWSMPIKAADGTIIGTYANYYREPRLPTERDMEVISMVARTTGILARQQAEEQRQLLFREMNHRVKNAFALASSLVTLSARVAKTPEELANTAKARLAALGRAHGLVKPKNLDGGWAPEDTTSLRAVLDDILAPYLDEVMMERVAISGADFALAPSAITSVALLFHEMTTNAVKYGCFAKPEGRLTVTWGIEGDRIDITWEERCPSTNGPPPKAGFGTPLIDGMVRQLHGSIEREWRVDSLAIRMNMPLSSIAQATQIASGSSWDMPSSEVAAQ